MTFQSIIGHRQQLDVLRNIVDNRRVAHAYLFEGPEGVGKKLVALRFVQALLCERKNGCGVCSACRKIDSGHHPDLFRLAGDGATIKIEKIRTLQQQLALRPFEGAYKICLIDGAEQLTTEAANALLKTLEEPQPGTLMILLSCQPDRLLPTIRSRCQRLSFSRLAQAELAAHLAQTLELSAAEAHVLAAVSDGSFKKALGQNQELYLKKRPSLIQSLSALSAGSTIQTFEFAEKLRTEKDVLHEILDIFQMFYRDLLLYKEGRPAAEMINQDLLPLIEQQSRLTSMARLVKKIEAVDSARMHLARNVNLHLAVEYMLLQMSHA